ncbi:MAG: insulinase family protein [Candidatus Woesearchaeota archaeon]|jgi:Zn-dependent M16 (insulinase) family peptidase|nr:insulinase family protein [Candidatus Woesearchaeota archaeon]
MENIELKINEIYEGFKLVEIEELKEVESDVYIFEHEKTRAKLMFMKNDSVDKTFSISFKTPPYDNTGLPHILEHSVLCGSKNFPIKDPFAQVVKSTINTFVNAFTFPDKTMYPFSTTNSEEYKKLMEVYLDAVLYPNIYSEKEIFLQEGWRFELNDKNDELKYSGVVYGEMKGAFSTPNRLLCSHSQRELFPNNCYGVESGGDPQDIVNLSYEDFLEFHRKYYHPTNSYIFLHGDLEIIEELKLINDKYLSNFDFDEEFVHKIKTEKPFDNPIEKVIEYPCSSKDGIEEKYLFGWNFVIGDATDYELMLGFDILGSILMGFESSPLKKALFKAELSEDVHGGFSEELILQPIFDLVLENTKLENLDKFKTVVYDTLIDLIKNGINEELIQGAINQREFMLKEGRFYDENMPNGILTNIKILDSWLYEGNPLGHIKYNGLLTNIKSKVKKEYFEELIEKYLINNNHNALLILKPNLELDFESDVKDKLKKYKENLSENEIEEIITQTKRVNEYQNDGDSVEGMKTIKVLDKEKIDKEPKFINTNINQQDNFEIIEYKTNTNNIDYINFYFDATKIPQDKIQYLSLLTAILEESGTKNYSLDDFANLINIYTGDLSIHLEGIQDLKKNLKPKLVVSTKILSQNYDKLAELLNETFNNIIIEEGKVSELLKKVKSRYENSIVNSGHSYAATRINSYYSNSGKYNELTKGIDFYNFIKNLDKNFSTKKDEIMKTLYEVYNLIFNKDKLILNITSTNFNFKELDKLDLKSETTKNYEYKFELKKLNEGFLTNSNVNYVGIGYDINLLDYKYSGTHIVLKNLLSYDYLWENLRVKGGAYGAMANITRNGSFDLISYRDPNLKKTYENYNKLVEYLNKLDLSEEEIRKNIIGTISSLDKPVLLEAESQRLTMNYIRGVDYEYLKNERSEILNTKLEDLKELKSMVNDVLKQEYKCSIGNSNLIKKDESEFENIVDIFN